MLLFASAAEAAPLDHAITPAAKLPAVGEVPKACASAGHLADNPRPQFALAARITLAECMANDALKAQTDLIDSQDSIAALEDGMAPSLALLDQAIATRDAKLVILGEHAKGAIYAAMTVRMQQAVPPLPASPSDEQVQLRNQRVAVLATWMQPWKDKQHAAFTRVGAVVQEHPRLANDAVVANAIADARKHLQNEPTVVAAAPNS